MYCCPPEVDLIQSSCTKSSGNGTSAHADRTPTTEETAATTHDLNCFAIVGLPFLSKSEDPLHLRAGIIAKAPPKMFAACARFFCAKRIDGFCSHILFRHKSGLTRAGLGNPSDIRAPETVEHVGLNLSRRFRCLRPPRSDLVIRPIEYQKQKGCGPRLSFTGATSPSSDHTC